jgi:DMSO/TMAO reductase YedYZ molybdopterin-dependent catalytic subunit
MSPTDRPESQDLVARRLAYIERMRKREPRTVDVDLRGRAPAGSGPTNRHGMPQLPVGQHEVKNWPVLDLGDVPKVPLERWRLEVDGLVENPLSLSWQEFQALPQVEDTSDFHCVTTWSRMDNRWKGVRFATLAELAVPKEKAHHVVTEGYDKMPGTTIPYTTNLPLVRAIEPDVLLVHTWEGKPLPIEHGGPVRMITPKLYAWKGAKWIRRITFVEHDRPGFWEVRGYSNSAEPWLDDRYSSARG